MLPPEFLSLGTTGTTVKSRLPQAASLCLAAWGQETGALPPWLQATLILSIFLDTRWLVMCPTAPGALASHAGGWPASLQGGQCTAGASSPHPWRWGRSRGEVMLGW